MPLTKYEVIVKAYDEVNALDKHEDRKAERAVQALAFLTLSAATIFAGSIYVYSVLKLNLPLLQVAYVLFVAFVVLLVLGTAIIIWAVSPRFNIPTPWATGQPGIPGTPPSLFFGMLIYKFPSQSWQEYWEKTPDAAIEALAVAQLAYETHLIAEKVVYKVRYLTIGFRLYLLSVFPLLAMVVALVAAVIG
jgi:hypothetical protein